MKAITNWNYIIISISLKSVIYFTTHNIIENTYEDLFKNKEYRKALNYAILAPINEEYINLNKKVLDNMTDE